MTYSLLRTLALAACCALAGCAAANAPATDIRRNQAKADAIEGFQRFCAKEGKNAQVTDLDDGVGELKFRFQCVKR